MTHLHVPRIRLPLALWDLHRVLAVGAPFELQALEGDYEGDALPGDDLGGRYFAGWPPSRLADQVTGAGFDIEPGSLAVSGDEVRLRAVRARTLADTVTAGMRLLVCGVNPSLYSADVGIGYARPGNRFWTAALAAGIVDRDRDPIHALLGHGIGMTDFVKRATRTAAEVTADEYRAGFETGRPPGRVAPTGSGLLRRPLGMEERRRSQSGGRAAARCRIGGRPAYVMPSTSGLNARTPVAELTDHLRAAVDIADAT